MKTLRALISAMCALTGAAVFASDDPFDGSRTLLCAASEAVQCTEADDCSVNPPEANNIPRFLRIDIANKTASAIWPAVVDKSSQIATVVNAESQLILQGVDGEVPWSAAIVKTTGKVVVSQSRGSTGFLIFGTCMPE